MNRRIVALALLAGCEKSVFTCMTDDNCVVGSMSGTCETDHLCSFPDPSCLVQRAYGPYSGDLSGECVPVNFMFVTNAMVDPTTLGVNGADPFVAADAFCANAASAAGLPGTYVAWISARGTSALERLESYNARGWIRPDTLPFVDTATDLAQGNILYPPRIDELGNDLVDGMTSPFVATGTLANGMAAPNAADWTDPTMMYQAGRLSAGRTGWSENTKRTGVAHLYCFGIDHQNAPPIPNAQGRIAFVSATAFMPGGGYRAADAVCAGDASAAGLTGTYLAFIATTTVSAAARFSASDASWIRRDGLPLETNGGDLLNGGRLATPIALGADGKPTQQIYRIWTGAQSPVVNGATTEGCSDWSSNAGSAISGVNSDSGPGFFHLVNNNTLCSSLSARLYCLQGP